MSLRETTAVQGIHSGAELRRRLEVIESETHEILAELARLRQPQRIADADAGAGALAKPWIAAPAATASSDSVAKIKVFPSLFRDREDVLPRR
jgi:hypothetical protein